MRDRSGRLVAVAAAAATISLSVLVSTAAPAAAAGESHPFPTHVTYKVGVTPSASQSTKDAKVEAAYDAWKNTYLIHGCASTEYYVSTKGDGDATNNGPVSEGQGYGMNIVPLMAGYDPNAKAEFDGLWKVVQDHRDSQGMMEWTEQEVRKMKEKVKRRRRRPWRRLAPALRPSQRTKVRA